MELRARFLPDLEIDLAQTIICRIAPDGMGAVDRANQLPILMQNEARGVDDTAPFFVEGPGLARKVPVIEAIRHGKGDALIIHEGACIFERIDRYTQHEHVSLRKFVDPCLEVGQLPTTIGSPLAPVPQNNGKIMGQIGG